MKTWKLVGGTLHGYGNGHKAVVYTFPFTDNAHVWVYKGDKYVNDHIATTVEAAKAWAMRHYLKGTNK